MSELSTNASLLDIGTLCDDYNKFDCLFELSLFFDVVKPSCDGRRFAWSIIPPLLLEGDTVREFLNDLDDFLETLEIGPLFF